MSSGRACFTKWTLPTVAALLGVASMAQAAEQGGPVSTRVYSDFAATEPGIDSFTAMFARNGGWQTFGLPNFGPGVVVTDSGIVTAWSSGFLRGTNVRVPALGDLRYHDDGFVAGLDVRLAEHAIVGISVSHASIGLSDSGSAGTAGGGATSVGLSAAASSDIVYGAAAAQYTFSSLSVRRTDSSGQLSPGTVRAGVLMGHFFDLSGVTFAPVGELQYAHTDSQTVSESGAGALTVDVPGYDTLTSRVGIRINAAFYRYGILGTPFVSVLWEHQLRTVVAGSGVSRSPSDPATEQSPLA